MHRDDAPLYLAVLALLVGILAPLLVVLACGWLWLWQNNYLLHWLIGALALTAVAVAGRAWVVAGLARAPDAEACARQARANGLAPREQAAWKAIEGIAATVSPARLTDRPAWLALGVETIEAVAGEMHPGVKEPVWRFTVPEALLLIEQVSARLRPLVRDAVPLGDRITVGQLLAIYRWRGLASTAERVYDLWRIVRLVNPVAASTQELRERLSKAVFEELREELAKRIARLYVREVGRAAVDLYSGRLRLSPEEHGAHVTAETIADRAAMEQPLEPLRLLVAGQTGVGKSSLINALAEEVHAAVDILPATCAFSAYEVQRRGMPKVFLIDSPGLSDTHDIDRLVEKALSSDLIVWAIAANRADRDRDREAVNAIRRRFAAMPERRPPDILPVITHIDRLRPFSEWAPPYDLVVADRAKARSIRDAMAAIAEDLGLEVGELVPVAVSSQHPAYNTDLVWARLADALPGAKSAQLLRSIGDVDNGLHLKRVLSQALRGGRLVAARLGRRHP